MDLSINISKQAPFNMQLAHSLSSNELAAIIMY